MAFVTGPKNKLKDFLRDQCPFGNECKKEYPNKVCIGISNCNVYNQFRSNDNEDYNDD